MAPPPPPPGGPPLVDDDDEGVDVDVDVAELQALTERRVAAASEAARLRRSAVVMVVGIRSGRGSGGSRQP
jgi:hypothetical protein